MATVAEKKQIMPKSVFILALLLLTPQLAYADPPEDAEGGGALPFLDGAELVPLRLFLRHHTDEEPSADGDRRLGLRFVLEAELSRLGLIQLDGLVRGRIFDLVVRSPRALDPNLQRDLRAIFAGAAVAASFSGKLDFQSSPIVLQTGVTGSTPMEGILA